MISGQPPKKSQMDDFLVIRVSLILDNISNNRIAKSSIAKTQNKLKVAPPQKTMPLSLRALRFNSIAAAAQGCAC